MNVTVRVQPKSSQEKVEAQTDGSLKVWVHAPAQDGKANEAVMHLLADHFGVSRKAVVLIKGEQSRNKMFSVTTTG